MPTTETNTDIPANQLEVIPRNFHISCLDDEKKNEDLGFSIEPTGEVILAEDQTVDQYKRGLQFFQGFQRKQKEWFSSYVSKGRAKFGIQLVEAALQQLEFEMPIVQQALDIASIPQELRHEGLNSEHFVVLARAPGLTATKRAKWAKTASELKLTPGQLKASIATGEVVSGQIAQHLNHGIMNVHGIHHEFDIWKRRIQDIDPGVLSLKLDEQDVIIKELKDIAEFYTELVARRGTKPTKKLEKAAAAKGAKAAKKPKAKVKKAKKKKK